MEASPELKSWIPEHATGAAVVLEPAAPRRRTGTTRVVIEDGLNPFERLSPDGRKRLLVRVLCGLVAYDTADVDANRLAG